MSKITTQVLDVVLGKPAAGIRVRLERREANAWTTVTYDAAGLDGRCDDLANDAGQGVYRLIFHTDSYWASHGRTSIYPEVSIEFACDGNARYHLPLLLSDNSYTTYRGS